MAKANNCEASLKKNMSHTEPMGQGSGGSKDNSECATLREGNKPKAEAVRQAVPQKGKAVEMAEQQNLSDDKSKGNLAVIPTTGILAPTHKRCK